MELRLIVFFQGLRKLSFKTLTYNTDMKQLTTFENHIIRHCKSNHYNVNILRRIVAKHTDLYPEHVDNHDIIYWLFKLCEEWELIIDMYSFLVKTNPANIWPTDTYTPTWEDNVIDKLASIIRLTPHSIWNGSYKIPAYFRNSKNNK